jgi:hypothetical protein
MKCEHGNLPDDKCYGNVETSSGIKNIKDAEAAMLRRKDFMCRLKHAQEHGWKVIESTDYDSGQTCNYLEPPDECEDWASRTNYIMIDGVPNCYVLPSYFWYNRAICPVYGL